MDNKALTEHQRIQLTEWFNPMQIERIAEMLADHNEKGGNSSRARETRCRLDRALAVLNKLMEELQSIAIDHPQAIENIDGFYRREIVMSGMPTIKNNDQPVVDEELLLKRDCRKSVIEELMAMQTALTLQRQNFSKRTIRCARVTSEKGLRIDDYELDGGSKNSWLIMDLSKFWKACGHEITVSDTSPFCRFLGVCLDMDASNAKRQYQRLTSGDKLLNI